MTICARWSLVIVALLVVPTPLIAQDGASTTNQPEIVPDIRSSNFIDFGYRGTSFDPGSDQARFERYRDLRNGPTLDLFRFSNETDARWFKVQADHVGYRDQRYAASYNNFGKLKVTFE